MADQWRQFFRNLKPVTAGDLLCEESRRISQARAREDFRRRSGREPFAGPLPVIRCQACGTPVSGGAFRRAADGMVMEPCGCVFRTHPDGTQTVTLAREVTEATLRRVEANIRGVQGLGGNGAAIYVPELADPAGQIEVAPDPGTVIERDLAADVCTGCGLAVPPAGPDHLCPYCAELAALPAGRDQTWMETEPIGVSAWWCIIVLAVAVAVLALLCGVLP